MVKTKNNIIIVFLIALILCVSLSALYAGRLLVLDQPPNKVDVIIVLGGDRGHRVEHGVSLYQAGYAPYMMISGGKIYHDITIAELMMDHAVRLGVPKENIILEPSAESTYENALYTKELIKRYGFKSAMIVSSNYHMRRVKSTYQSEFKDISTTLIYSAAKDPNYNPDKWWKNSDSFSHTITEYIKIITYAIGIKNLPSPAIH